MTLDITTVPNPLFKDETLSAIRGTRRMMLLRWSVEEYLSAVAGNYGLRRPPLGFSLDDFFRACAQVLMADTKGVSNTFWQLLEIAFGPSENLVFDLESNAEIGDGYVVLAREMEYAGYSATAGAFVADEIITGGTSNATARFRYLDTTTGKKRIFFKHRVGDFISGETVTGGGGATVVLDSTTARQVSDATIPVTHRLPLFNAKVKINPGLGGEEIVSFGGVDKFLRRGRLKVPLTKAHNAKSVVLIEGGQWDLFSTKARRISVRLISATGLVSRLPGNSYLHQQAWHTSIVRQKADAGDPAIYLDESYVDGFPSGAFTLEIDPFEKQGDTQYVTVNSLNATTLQLNLAPVLASTVRRGTEVRWASAEKSGNLLVDASASDTEVKAYARYKDVKGTWILDSGGVPEKVFVTKTTYQRRRLVAPIDVGNLHIIVDKPFSTEKGLDLTGKYLRVYDLATGHKGTLQVSTVLDSTGNSSQYVTVAVASAFATVESALTYVELVDTSAGQVTLTLSRGLLGAHPIGTTFQRYYGLAGSTLDATYADHVPVANWPTSMSASPSALDGRWTGPNCFDPSQKQSINIKESSASSIEAIGRIANADPTDARSYLVNTTLAERFNPFVLAPSPGSVVINSVTYLFQAIRVPDASVFPTVSQVNTFRTSSNNNNNPFPTRVVIGGEGLSGGSEVYLWGREEKTGIEPRFQRVLVSGLKRVHLAGTNLQTYQSKQVRQVLLAFKVVFQRVKLGFLSIMEQAFKSRCNMILVC